MAKKPSTPVQGKAAPAAEKASLAAAGFESVTLDTHYVPARLPTGKVIGVWGNALIRRSSGEIQPAQVGDEVQKGDVILTTQDGIVQLEGAGMRLARLPGLVESDRTLAAGEEQFEPPAAGLTGGGEGSFQPGLRVDRIAEAVSPLEYAYDGAANRVVPLAGDVIQTTTLPSLSINNITTPEASGFAVFTVQLSAASTTPTSVALTLAPGSANAAGSGANADFGSTDAGNLQVSLDGGQTWANAATVAIPAGQTGILVRTPLVNDALNEAAETFTLTATPTAGAVSTLAAVGTATIIDDDPQPVLAINDVVVNEGAGNAVFTVSLSAPSGQAVTVNWATIDGSAVGGADFTTLSGSVTFAPGETTKSIAIPVLNDTVFERSEVFNVQLGNPVNAAIGDGLGQATIADDGTGGGGTTDNDTPIVSLSGPAQVNEAAGTVTYTVTLSNLSTLPVTVPYFFSGAGTTPATIGSDLIAVAGSVTIPAGSLTGTFTARIVEDTVFEGVETFSANIGIPTNAILGIPEVLTSISDAGTGFTPDGSPPTDDRPVVSQISSPTVREGGALDFVVTLSSTSTTDTVVTLTPGNGSATFGSDTSAALQVSFDGGTTFTAVTGGQVNVPAGGSGFTVRMVTVKDGVIEATETVTLAAGTAQNATPLVGTGTILDDDTPTVTLSGPVSVNEAAGTLTYTVLLSKASPFDVTVPFDFEAGTPNGATPGVDFTTGTGRSLTIRAGETTGTITVNIIDDTAFEGPETFNVVLLTPTNALLGTATSVTTTIFDDGSGNVPPGVLATDDRAPTVATASVFEGGALSFAVTLPSHAQATAYAFALTPQGSTSAADYNAAGITFTNGVTLLADGRLSVPADVTSFQVIVPTLDDSIVEANETLTLQIGNAAPVVGTILNEDATATVDESALPVGNLESAATQLAAANAAMGFGDTASTYRFAADVPATLTTGNYTSKGSSVAWSLSADGLTLTGSSLHAGAEGAVPVLTVSLNAATGATVVTLLDAFDQATGAGANTLTLLPVTINATSSTGIDARSLNISVVDDVPTASAQSKSVAMQDTNLLIVLDTSGSMRDTDGRTDGKTRLDIAIASVKELMTKYEAAGDVRVTLLTFDSASGADQIIAKGATVADAIAKLDAKGLLPNGFTNYDAAYNNAIAAFNDPATTKLANAANVSYFFSDGKPEGATDSETQIYSLDASDQAKWNGFLVDKDIQSYAIGIGPQLVTSANSAAFVAALGTIAHDGRNDTDPANGVILVQNVADLSGALASTIPAPITGTLLGTLADTVSHVGADGGSLSNVSVGTENYTFNGSQLTSGNSANYDGTTHVLTLQETSGVLKLNVLTGSYSFDATTSEALTVDYVVKDADGDTAASTLTVQGLKTIVNPGATMGDDVITASGSQSQVIDGRAGNDVVTGGSGIDIIFGGAGNDILNGGLGSDVFAWRLGDVQSGTKSVDTVLQFNTAAASAGGDILDLRDLLQGESANSTSLGQYLDFETLSGTTTLHVKATTSGPVVQDIVLSGVDLGGSNTDAQIIQTLLNQGKLLVDTGTGG